MDVNRGESGWLDGAVEMSGELTQTPPLGHDGSAQH